MNGDRPSSADVTVQYEETEAERRLRYETNGRTAVVVQPRQGYGMLVVRDGTGRELERYYGFDMALDHAGEWIGVPRSALPVPDEAADFGM